MFEITNVSNNQLQLSDGKGLAPGATKKLKTVSDHDRNYQDRGWLLIVEDKPATEKTEVKNK